MALCLVSGWSQMGTPDTGRVDMASGSLGSDPTARNFQHSPKGPSCSLAWAAQSAPHPVRAPAMSPCHTSPAPGLPHWASLGLAGPTPWRPLCPLSPRPRPVLLFLSLLPRDSLPTPPSSLPAIPATVHSACCFLDGSFYYLARCVFILIVHYVLSLLLLSSVSHVLLLSSCSIRPIITQLGQVFIVNILHVVSFFLSTYVSDLSHLGHVSVVNLQSEQVPPCLFAVFRPHWKLSSLKT